MSFRFFVVLICLTTPAVAVSQDTENPKVAAEEKPPDVPQVEASKTSVKTRTKGWFKRHHTSNSQETKEEDIKQKALKIPTGSQVKIVSNDKTKVAGKLTKMTNEAVTVKTAGKNRTQSVPFTNISSIKKTRTPKFGSPGLENTDRIDTSLAAIPKGTPVNLKLADKSKVSGRYEGRTANDMTVQVPQDGKMVDRKVALDQITSVKQPKPTFFSKPSLESPAIVKKTISGISPGSTMSVKTPGGETVDGKLMGTNDSGFSLQTLEGGNLVTKNMAFDQVASVKPTGLGVKNHIPGLHPPAVQASPQLKSEALAIPAGSPVTLQLPNGSKTTGKLMGVTNDGMQVQSLQAGNVVTQNVGYDQIGSIKQGAPTTASTRVKKAGTAAALVIVTGIISGALAKAF